jgi:hypothetical protein
MAKRKRATALFEVMSRGKLPGPGGSSIPNSIANGENGSPGASAPRWWFRSRNSSESRTIPPVESESVSHDYAAPSEPEPVAIRVPSLASSIDVPQSTPGAPAPRVQPVAVSVDPERQQISLRLSYTSALIGGFGLMIALGIAILIGKGLSRGPSTAIAGTSSSQLKQRPPTPGVLNVPKRGEVLGTNDTVEGMAARPANSTSTGTRNPQQTVNDPRPPATFFTDDPHRQNGLNYAIIQSYPDRETAEKAAEFLTKSGIPCTVERNLPNWKLPWPDASVVVGIRGFAKVQNNPALDAYKKSIMEVSAKFSNGRNHFTAFAPFMYQWKRSN